MEKDSQKRAKRRKDGTETSVEVFTELNRRIMLVARGTASEMAKTLKLTRTILGKRSDGANGSQFEALHDLRHRNLVSSAAQYLDTYRSWPGGHVFCCWSPGLVVIPLVAGVAG